MQKADNIKMDLKGLWYFYVDWILLVHCKDQLWALVNTVLNHLILKRQGFVRQLNDFQLPKKTLLSRISYEITEQLQDFIFLCNRSAAHNCPDSMK